MPTTGVQRACPLSRVTSIFTSTNPAARIAPASILITMTNLANTYQKLGRVDEALRVRQEVYSGRLRLDGEEHERTLTAASHYSSSLIDLKRFEEAKALLRKMLPVARRVLGENYELTLRMRWVYAQTLYADTSATLDDIREAVTTLEDTARTSRRVLGGTHPLVAQIEQSLRHSRAALDTRETKSA